MTLAQTLRDIADELQARVDGGDFALCFAHVQGDMATLPAKLHELAAQAEKAEKDAYEAGEESGHATGFLVARAKYERAGP